MDFPIESSISNLGLAMFHDTSVVPEQVLDPRGSAMPSPVVEKIMVIFESWSWYIYIYLFIYLFIYTYKYG